MNSKNDERGPDVFNGLEPAGLWNYFYEICQIPRPSSKEQKIISYLKEFGKKNSLETLTDETGNVVIRIPASEGFESRKSICLQSHVDMVAEKNSDSTHNFDTDPIRPVIDGEWIKADGTTLGADDGIGVASQLALLTDKSIKHGPVECLFTVEEELGLKGAYGLKPGFINSNILINLDSEDEGELFIGCAGGMNTTGCLRFKTRPLSKNSAAFKIGLSGLAGGHSGDDINKGRGNSIKELNRFLWAVSRRMKVRLAVFEGGNLSNAIPREAYAVIVIDKSDVLKLKSEFNQFIMAIKNELVPVEPDIEIKMEPCDLPQFVLKRKFQRRLLNMLYGCPHGVIAMSRAIGNLVETSTNLASVRFSNQQEINVTTSQRSSVESGRQNVVNTVRSVFELAKASVEHSDGYPGWSPNTASEILNITKRSYKRLYKKEPVVRAIHAGLECGLFLEKYPKLDMISFGPTIRNAHSPDERVEIKTVKKYWDLLLDVLQNIPEKTT